MRRTARFVRARLRTFIAAELYGCEMNSYHLMNKPGREADQDRWAGLHGFTGYKGAILTDSGGFQLYSLIRENAEYGEIRDKEIIFRPDRGKEKMHVHAGKVHTGAVPVWLGHHDGAGHVHTPGRPDRRAAPQRRADRALGRALHAPSSTS